MSSPAPPTTPRPARRKVAHTVTLGRPADEWLIGRMTERGQDRSTILENLIFDRIDHRRDGVDVAADLSTIRRAIDQLRLEIRNPDHLRAVVEIDAACSSIGRRLAR